MTEALLPKLHYTSMPSHDDLSALTAILGRANAAEGWPNANYEEFGLFVQFLAVPEGLRGKGLGEHLLSKAEQFALQRGGIGMWLDTFEFGPVAYYTKLGFTLIGTIEDHALGSRRHFLQKRFS